MDEDVLNDSQNEGDSQLKMTESQERLAKYRLFVVKPEDVEPLWNAEDPCKFCQDLLQDYMSVYSSELKKDINAYSANEMRYEPHWELKWLADYIVNGLVLLKHDLKMEDCDGIAETLNALWETLDFLNVTDEI